MLYGRHKFTWFQDSQHEADFVNLLNNAAPDPYWEAFCYVLAGTGRARELGHVLSHRMTPEAAELPSLSSGQSKMVRTAIHLWNGRPPFGIVDNLGGLDRRQKVVCLEAIKHLVLNIGD